MWPLPWHSHPHELVEECNLSFASVDSGLEMLRTDTIAFGCRMTMVAFGPFLAFAVSRSGSHEWPLCCRPAGSRLAALTCTISSCSISISSSPSPSRGRRCEINRRMLNAGRDSIVAITMGQSRQRKVAPNPSSVGDTYHLCNSDMRYQPPRRRSNASSEREAACDIDAMLAHTGYAFIQQTGLEHGSERRKEK